MDPILYKTKINSFEQLWDKCNPGNLAKNPFRRLKPNLLKKLIDAGKIFWTGLDEIGQLEIFEKIRTIPIPVLNSAISLKDLWKRIPVAQYRIKLFDRVRQEPNAAWNSLLPAIKSIPKETSISPALFSMIEQNPSSNWGFAYKHAEKLLQEHANPITIPNLAKLILEDQEQRDWELLISAALYILREDISNIDRLIELTQFIIDNTKEELEESSDSETWSIKTPPTSTKEFLFWENVIDSMRSIWKEEMNLWVLFFLIRFYPYEEGDDPFNWKVAISTMQEILSDIPLSKNTDLSFIKNIYTDKDSEIFLIAKNLWENSITKNPIDRFNLLETVLLVEGNESILNNLVQATKPIWEKYSLLTDRTHIFGFILDYASHDWGNLINKALPLLPIIKDPMDWFEYCIYPMLINPSHAWDEAFSFLPIILQEEVFSIEKKSDFTLNFWKKDLMLIQEIASNPKLNWAEKIRFAQTFWVGISDPPYKQSSTGRITRSNIIKETPFPLPNEWQNAQSLIMSISKDCNSIFLERWHWFKVIVHKSQNQDWENIIRFSEPVWKGIEYLTDRFELITYIQDTPHSSWGQIIDLGRQIWEGSINNKSSRLEILESIRLSFYTQNWELAIENAKKERNWSGVNSSSMDRLKIVTSCLLKLPILI
jgi:hypothetical protein